LSIEFKKYFIRRISKQGNALKINTFLIGLIQEGPGQERFPLRKERMKFSEEN
jgi:hypothetical protein